MCGPSRGPTTATRARTPASIKHMWSATGQRQHGAVVAAVTLSDREQHGRWRAPFVAASTSPSRVGTAARTASTRVCQKGWSHGLAAAVAVLSTPSAPSCLVETHSARGTSEEGTCRGKDAHAGGLDREVPRADKEREGEGQRAPKLQSRVRPWWHCTPHGHAPSIVAGSTGSARGERNCTTVVNSA